jgi:DNA-binding response OmpR family regulator
MYTILIIEDDFLCQECYRETLIQEGYQIVSAMDGKDGLTKLEKYKPELLILDLAMPGVSGRSLLWNLRKVAKEVPVIIVSGKTGMEDDPEIQMSPQVYRFFSKPVKMKELVSAIRQILARTKRVKKTWEGKILGGCLLDECVGSGGSGSVYKASQKGHLVAIKILPKTVLDYEEQLARFHREAELLAQIKHPNVIGVHEIGYDEGVHFIVMEYFDGENVSRILEMEQYFSLREGMEIIKQVAQGMEAAHGLELVHRDLKPSNFLYDRQNRLVKVIDFGLARKIEQEHSITQQGYVVGTPDYMSPEQCEGIAIDGRSDIYSLGITFYQLLLGVLPFRKSTTMQILLAQIQESLAWPEIPSQPIPPHVREIIVKMTAKNPDRRYLSMREVVEVIEQAQRNS